MTCNEVPFFSNASPASPKKDQRTRDFLIFLGGTKRNHWGRNELKYIDLHRLNLLFKSLLMLESFNWVDINLQSWP